MRRVIFKSSNSSRSFSSCGVFAGVVGAHDLAEHLARQLAQLRAEAIFVIAAEVAHHFLEVDGEIESFFVNGEVFVLGHEHAPRY
jgi:hypothetical protein